MKTGAPTDIVSGKPIEQVTDENTANAQKRQEDILKNQARYLGLSKSADGQALIEMVQSLLEKRIDELITADPKAQGFVQVLNALGIREVLAKKATEKLIAMKIKE